MPDPPTCWLAPASRPRSRPRLQGSTTGRTPTVKQPAWGSCTPPPTTALGLQVASLVAHSRDHRGRGKALSLVMRSLVCRRLPRRTPHLRQGRQRQPHRLARGTRRVDTSVRRGGSGRRHAPEGRRCGVPILLTAEVTPSRRSMPPALTWADRWPTANSPRLRNLPWHGSTFRLADGDVVRGPATIPQPCYEAPGSVTGTSRCAPVTDHVMEWPILGKPSKWIA